MTRWTWLFPVFLIILAAPEPAVGQRSQVVARGARLWNATCNRCHNLRPPSERTDRQWDVITSHMRTRANLTKAEVQAIAAFLKQVNANRNPRGERLESAPDSTATDP